MNNNKHYTSFFIKIKSKVNIFKAIDLLSKDSILRSFRSEYKWEIEDEKNKIVKIYLKDPENEFTINKKVKGKCKKLKFDFYSLGDLNESLKATDKEKFIIKKIIDSYFIRKLDNEEIFPLFFDLFSEEKEWSKNYIRTWKYNFTSLLHSNFPASSVKVLNPRIALNQTPYNKKLVDLGFKLLTEAIDNKDLDISSNFLKSSIVINKFNI